MMYFGEGFGRMAEALVAWVAVLVPHPGMRWQPDGPAPRATLSWPWSLPFGPVGAISQRHCSEDLHYPNRIVLEPGLTLTSSVGLFVRAGYRFLWQRAESRVGLGAGLGGIALLRGPGTPTAGFSPELLVRYGRCCRPAYLLLSVRYDIFPAGAGPNAVAASLGLTFW
jgi:hypothetical protein